MAILGRLNHPEIAIREIVGKLEVLDDPQRCAAGDQLMILAGLRLLEDKVEEEIRKMPITADIMTHKIVAREYNRGKQEGKQEGKREGKQEGEHIGELTIIRKQLVKRFGLLPEWVDQKLSASSSETLEAISLRLLDADTLEELLGGD